MLTPLHLALGLADADLSFSHVQLACDQRVKEREDLDWKQQLPLTISSKSPDRDGRNREQDELAKDIAAMANSRGGLIVFGVAEDRPTSEAVDIKSVGKPDDTTVVNIRRAASSRIHPPVLDLQFTWLTGEDQTVLLLQIPQSGESPHLMHPRNQGDGTWFAAPYRNGPHTEWMTEKMIESAYRDRLLRRSESEADLRHLHATLAAATSGNTNRAWVVAVARPENPLPRHPRLSLQKSSGIFSRAWNSHWYGFLNNGAVDAEWMLKSEQPRRGFRKYRQTALHRVTAAPNGQGQIMAVAEIHFDGSVGVALTRGGAISPNEQADQRFMSPVDLDQAVLNLFVLVRQVAQDLQVVGDYEVLVDIAAKDGVLFRRPDPMLRDHFQPFTEDDNLPPFQPVDGAFLVSRDLETALTSLVAIGEDAVNQTGSASMLDVRELALHAEI